MVDVEQRPRVTLLTRPGCHLCDTARDVVRQVSGELGVGWVEQTIDDDATLRERYAEEIPVVLVDGVQHAYWRVDADRLRSALGAGPPGRTGGWLRRSRSGPRASG